jgi:hypothetical protein
MPEIQKIERIKTKINSLGNEPSILAEQGEALEDVKVPESEISPDLQDMLDDAQADVGSTVSDLVQDADLNEMDSGEGSELDEVAELVGDDSDGTEDLDEILDLDATEDLDMDDELFSEISAIEETDEEALESSSGTDINSFLDSFEEEIAQEQSEPVDDLDADDAFFNTGEEAEFEAEDLFSEAISAGDSESSDQEDFEFDDVFSIEDSSLEDGESPIDESQDLDSVEVSEDDLFSFDDLSAEDLAEEPGQESEFFDDISEEVSGEGTEPQEQLVDTENLAFSIEEDGQDTPTQDLDNISSVSMDDIDSFLNELGDSKTDESSTAPGTDQILEDDFDSGIEDISESIDRSDADDLFEDLRTEESSEFEDLSSFDISEDDIAEEEMDEAFDAVAPEEISTSAEEFLDGSFEELGEEFDDDIPSLDEGFDELEDVSADLDLSSGLPEATEGSTGFELDDDFSFSDADTDISDSQGFDLGEELSLDEGAVEDLDLSLDDADSFGDLGEMQTAPETSADDSDGLEFDLGEFEPSSVEDGFSGLDLSTEDEEPEMPDSFAMPEGMGLSDEDDFSLDDFKLGDISEQFAGLDDAEISDEELNPAEAIGDTEIVDERFSLSEDEFAAIQQYISTLPRNLALEVAKLIGVQNVSGRPFELLFKALKDEVPPKDLADLVSRIIGKKIKIPAQYLKLTAEQFEAEKQSFAYVFRENFLPIFTTVFVTSVVVLVLGLLGYQYIYKPVYATSLYNQGYEAIMLNQTAQGNELFERAVEVQPQKPQYFRYAEVFIEQDRRNEASAKYEAAIDRYPFDKQARLDYGNYLANVLLRYEDAENQFMDYLDQSRVIEDLRQKVADGEEILAPVSAIRSVVNNLDRTMNDSDTILALGDMYLDWAEIDQSKFEEARKKYAHLRRIQGDSDMVVQRFLRLWLRTDNFTEVQRLRTELENRRNVDVDPKTYAELAGYYIDRNEFAGIEDLVRDALEVNFSEARLYYQMARLSNLLKRDLEEEAYLTDTLRFIDEEPVRTPEVVAIEIDATRRMGEVLFRADREADSFEYFEEARDKYEFYLQSSYIEPEPKYGKIYENIGDVYYFERGDRNSALLNYLKAEENLFRSRELSYKIGAIYYFTSNYKNAISRFDSIMKFGSNENQSMWSMGNSLMQDGAYEAAEGYYKRVLDNLERETEGISFLRPEENPQHLNLVQSLIQVNNNLGASIYEQDPESSAIRSTALSYFTEAVRLYDVLKRNPQTLEKEGEEIRSLLNIRTIIYPDAFENEIILYTKIPRSLGDLSFGPLTE